jgi:hypothetical protein
MSMTYLTVMLGTTLCGVVVIAMGSAAVMTLVGLVFYGHLIS